MLVRVIQDAPNQQMASEHEQTEVLAPPVPPLLHESPALGVQGHTLERQVLTLLPPEGPGLLSAPEGRTG